MTLLTIEGFESKTPNSWWSGWTSASTTTGRFGGQCLNGASPTYAVPDAPDEVVFGFAWKIQYLYTNTITLTSVNGSNLKLIMQNQDGRFQLLRNNSGSGTTLSANPLLINNTWHYCEVSCKFADVGGYIELKVDGNVAYSFTGDTLPAAGDARIASIKWDGSNNQLDDVYVLNKLGAAPYNSYLGEVQIETLFPNGNGTFSQLVGSDGNSTDNYLLVDEAPVVDADLVSSDVVGNRDTYQFTNPVMTSGQVLAVQVQASVSKSNAGPAKARIIERMAGGTEREHGDYVCTNLTAYTNVPQTTAPDGTAWTIASVSGAEFGVEVA